MNADAAAALLGTSTTILGVWEERFGFPVALRSDDGQRLYPDEMMIALRHALSRQWSVASAISEARRAQTIRPAAPDREASHRDRLGWSRGNPEEAC